MVCIRGREDWGVIDKRWGRGYNGCEMGPGKDEGCEKM